VAGDDDVLALEQFLDGFTETFDLAAVGGGTGRARPWLWFPPFTAGVGLIPVGADAGLAGRRRLWNMMAILPGSAHSIGMRFSLSLKAAQRRRCVFDDVGGVLALEVEQLLVIDELAFLVDLLDLEDEDVGRLIDDARERVALLGRRPAPGRTATVSRTTPPEPGRGVRRGFMEGSSCVGQAFQPDRLVVVRLESLTYGAGGNGASLGLDDQLCRGRPIFGSRFFVRLQLPVGLVLAAQSSLENRIVGHGEKW